MNDCELATTIASARVWPARAGHCRGRSARSAAAPIGGLEGSTADCPRRVASASRDDQKRRRRPHSLSQTAPSDNDRVRHAPCSLSVSSGDQQLVVDRVGPSVARARTTKPPPRWVSELNVAPVGPARRPSGRFKLGVVRSVVNAAMGGRPRTRRPSNALLPASLHRSRMGRSREDTLAEVVRRGKPCGRAT